MSTTLDLRNARRLFYGSAEARKLYYGEAGGLTLLWEKPAESGGAASLLHSGRVFWEGDPGTGYIEDMPLEGAAFTDGAGIVTIASYDSSFNHVPEVSALTLTPIDGGGVALGPAVAASLGSANNNSYAATALWDVAMTLPAGTAALRLTFDVTASGTNGDIAFNLYDPVGLAGAARAIENISLTNFAGTHNFVSPYAASLFVAAAGHRRGADWTAFAAPTLETIYYLGGDKTQAARGGGSPVSLTSGQPTGIRTSALVVFYDIDGL